MKKIGNIRVMLADDHTIFREGLRALLEEESDIEVVGESSDGAELLEMLARLTPDVIVMDIGMPEVSGLEATRRIRSAHSGIRVLILSMSAHPDDVDQAIAAGVNGYLVKETAANDLLHAIRGVMIGNAFFSPSIAKILLATRQSPAMRPPAPHLTSREREILTLIAASKTNRDIALILSISPKTVDKHRGQIMSKLDIHDIAGLTRYAMVNGFLK
jgi:DNA-binding NarL/FixJ family response regulator